MKRIQGLCHLSRLRKLVEALGLKTIHPSRIVLERTIIVMGFYNTKFRCSLGDQSINALVILMHIFQKEKQVEKGRIEKERLERIIKLDENT